jgi:hypothetical protein
MASKRSSARVISLPAGDAAHPPADQRFPFSARLIAISGDGHLIVRDAEGQHRDCDWLAGPGAVGGLLAIDDLVLVQPLASGQRAVVMGRIGPYTLTPERVTIEAAQELTLRCGESSVELRADGKVMVRGDDVLIRAKGTQRIRAGNVAIN